MPPVSRVTTPIAPAADLAEAASAALTDGGCDLTEIIQAAVRDDVDARSALQSLPQAAHSVANAIMLWDGSWTADKPTSADALTPVRKVLVATVANASTACREAVQAGPRLVTVAGPPDMVLAIGSGRWRWGDLLPLDLKTAQAAPDVRAQNTETTDLAESEDTAR